MAKGQNRPNREVRKPKKDKAPAPSTPALGKGMSSSGGNPKKK